MSLLEGYRLFTGYYIYESEALPSAAKLEFVQFLKEASADDIVDILSGQYEGVEGLSEEEMESVHDFLEERFGMKRGAAYVGKKAAAGKEAVKGAPKFIKKKLGYEEVGKAKAELKRAKAAKGKGVKKTAATGAAGKRLRKAYAGAVGRTALAASPVAAAGGGAVYMKKKK